MAVSPSFNVKHARPPLPGPSSSGTFVESPTRISLEEKTAPFLLISVEWVLPGVVEGGFAFDVEGHFAPNYPHVAHQPVPFGWLRRYRHEVQGLSHAVVREETGEQHVGVRQVELLAVEVLHGMKGKVTALLVVQDGTEDARGIERRDAQPVYRAVGADERCRVKVSYYPVVLYWEITQSSSSSHRMTTNPILHPPTDRGKALPQ